MKCLICKHGETQPGTTTVTLERGTTTVVFKNVLAEVCQTCGEAYLDAATTRQLLHIVEEAARLEHCDEHDRNSKTYKPLNQARTGG